MELATSQLRGLSIGRPDRIHYLCLDVLRLIFEMLPLSSLLVLSLMSKRFNEWVKPHIYRNIKIPFTPRSNSLLHTLVNRLYEDRDLAVSVRSLSLGSRHPEKFWESMTVTCPIAQAELLMRLIGLLTNLRSLYWNISPSTALKWCLNLIESKGSRFALELGPKTVAMEAPQISCIVNYAVIATPWRYPTLMKTLPSYENLKSLQLQFMEPAAFKDHLYLSKVFSRLRSLSLNGLWPGDPWEEPTWEHAVDLSQLEELRLEHCSAHWWLNPTIRNLKYFKGTCMPINPTLLAVPAQFKNFLERNTSLESLHVIGFNEYGDLQWLAPLGSSLHNLSLAKGRFVSVHLLPGYKPYDLTSADFSKIGELLPLLRVFSVDVMYTPLWPNDTLNKIIRYLRDLDHLTLRPCQDEEVTSFLVHRPAPIRSIWELEMLTYIKGPVATLQTTRQAWTYFLEKGVTLWEDPHTKLAPGPDGHLPPPKKNTHTLNFFDEQRPNYEDYLAWMEIEKLTPCLPFVDTAWPGFEPKRSNCPRSPQVYPPLKTLTLIGGSPYIANDSTQYIEYSCTASRYWDGPEYDLGTADIYCKQLDDIERADAELGQGDTRAAYAKKFPEKTHAITEGKQMARLLAQYGTTEPKPKGYPRDSSYSPIILGLNPDQLYAGHEMPFGLLSTASVLDPYIGEPVTVSPGRVRGMRILTKDSSYSSWQHGLANQSAAWNLPKQPASKRPSPDSVDPSPYGRKWKGPRARG